MIKIVLNKIKMLDLLISINYYNKSIGKKKKLLKIIII